MEGQQQTFRLAPYLRPEAASAGSCSRGLARHGFLSNRWGLRQHRISHSQPALFHRGISLSSAFQSGLATGAIRAEEAQAALHHNFGVIQRELLEVKESIDQIDKTTDRLAKQFTQGLEKVLERQRDMGLADRIEQLLDAQKASLQREFLDELARLRAGHERDKERLRGVERDLEAANLQAQTDARELVETQRMLEARLRESVAVGQTDEEQQEAIHAAFRSLRESVLGFARSFAVRSSDMPDSLVVTDSLFDPRGWNRAGPRQRNQRVMAKVFHVLFRRILRPGLRAFGVQAFLRSEEHHAISAAEAHLRALERDLEKQGVARDTLNSWITATIDITEPLRNVRQNVEGITQEILDALTPVIRHGFVRNAERARAQIMAICEEAVRLKLALRRASGRYKIEVPSRDTKRWGDAGYDPATRDLPPVEWLQVVDHEVMARTEEMRGAAGDNKNIVCIPFGALTKIETAADGGGQKTVLERGWVVTAKAPEGTAAKRGPPSHEARRKGEAPGRVAPAIGISPHHLARIKALMGQE